MLGSSLGARAATLACLGALLMGSSKAEADRPVAGSVTSERLKVPSGPSSVRGLADEPTVDPFYGQVNYQVPIELPAGLGGLAPSLALTYSGALGNGPIGIGWTLTPTRIQRSTRLGVPRFDDTDTLEIVGVASGRLIPVGGDEYRVEGMGQSVRVRRVDAGFEVDDGNGIRYRLGMSTTARQEADATHTVAWLVETQANLMGEQIRYEYAHDQGQVYLTGITWGPNGAYHTELVYEVRRDATRSYREGFAVVTAQRLATIRTFAFGIERRAYRLAYDETFSVDRLAGVTSSGKAGVGAWPALTFSYAASAAPVVGVITGAGVWRLNSNGTTLVDLDGDGAAELLQLADGGHSYRTNQNGTFGNPQALSGNSMSIDALQLQDLDGDSRAELVQDTGNGWSVWKFSRTKWVKQVGTWPGSEGVTLKDPEATRFADLNGDNLVDAIQWDNDNLKVRWATRTGLSASVSLPRIAGTVLPTDEGRFLDANGDGLDDYVVVALDRLELYLGRGGGTFDPMVALDYPFSGTVSNPDDIEFGDLDRDGLIDLIRVDLGTVQWFRGCATGGFIKEAVTVANPEPRSTAVVVSLADSNGNGSLDIVWSSASGMWRMDMAGATSAGMLVGVSNGLGMNITFEYRSSHELSVEARLADDAWTVELPIASPVPVTKTTVLGPGETTREIHYGVRDGFWDALEQRFGGFRTTTVTTSGATTEETSTVITRYNSGTGTNRVLRGRPSIEQVKNGNGVRLSMTVSTWETMAVTGLPDVPLLRRAVLRDVQTQFEDVTPFRETSVTYDYDELGRPRHIVNNGRLDLSGDETVKDSTYADDETTWIRDQLCEEKVSGLDGVLVSHAQHLFGDADVVQPLCVVGKGWPRETRSWLDTEQRFVTQLEITYDRHGNRLSVRNNGTERRFVYDSNGLFPIEEHLTAPDRDLVWHASWDSVLGAMETVTDPNGHTIYMSYDSLGRSTGISLHERAPHQVVEYDWTAPFPKTTVWQFDGALDNVSTKPAVWSASSHWRQTINVHNGKGEVRYHAQRLDDARWIISDYHEVDANSRVVFAGRPVLASQLELSSRPEGIVGDVLAYDPLGRLIEQDLPTGAKRIYSYIAFERTMQDADLAPVHSVLDGQGRAILTERSLADGTHELVQARYDAAGRLTEMTLSGGTVTRAFTYDTLGRLTRSEDPDLGSRTLAWDDSNHLLSEVNAAGQISRYTYDSLGRLSTRDTGLLYLYHYDAARPGGTGPTVNLLGMLAWVEEPTGGIDLGYDELGRTTFTRRRIDGQTSESTTSYAASGLVLGRSFDDGFSHNYDYDPAGRMIGAGGLWTVLEQDASGRVLHETMQNGVDTRYARDILGLPSAVTVRDIDGRAIYDVVVERNTALEIITEVDRDGTGLDHSAIFGYDGFARLTAATVGSGAQAFAFNYGYDVLHNMTSRTASGRTIRGAMFGTYRYGEQGRAPRQLTSIAGTDDQVVHTFDYDAAGRQIAQDALHLTFDASDRVTRVTGLQGGSGMVTHAYGHNGDRVKTVAPDGIVSYFFGDGTSLRNGVREHDVSVGDRVVARVSMAPPIDVGRGGAASQLLALVVRFVTWGLSCATLVVALATINRVRRRRAGAVAMIGLTLAASCAPTSVSILHDTVAVTHATFLHVGFGAGPVVFSDAGGHLLEERRYEPFGAPIDARVQTGDGVLVGAPDLIARDLNPLNKRSDAATGWSDHGERWLAPETGRWLSPDPPISGPHAQFMAAPWALHPYQYVQQNPVAYWDPDGRSPDGATLGASGAAIVAAGARVAAQLSRFSLPGRIAGGIVIVGTLVGAAAYENTRSGANVCYGVSDCTDSGGVPYELTAAYEEQKSAAEDRRLALIRARVEAANAAATTDKKEKTILLHRGVPSWHPGYDDATLGNAYPRGGNASPDEHNAGDTDSEYTSWTTTWSIAESAALDSHYGTSGSGVVLTARIPTSRVIRSRDLHEEDEYLVKGAVTGAAVRYVPLGGHQPPEIEDE